MMNGRVIEHGQTPMLSVTQYIAASGLSERTVRRCLADGRLPGAVQDPRGQWSIPAGILPLPAGTGTVVALTDATPAPMVHGGPRTLAPGLWDLDDAAQQLGISVGGLRRLAELRPGYLIGPWGRNRRPMLDVLASGHTGVVQGIPY